MEREGDGQTRVRLILFTDDARRMKKPQPFASAADIPMCKAIVLMADGDVLAAGWEDWQQTSPTSQIRQLPNPPRSFVVTLFGNQLEEEEIEVQEPAGDQDRSAIREADRKRNGIVCRKS